jgi:DNA-binding phage protein
MTLATPASQVHVRLLANRQGKLGALMWSTSNPDTLPTWLGQDSVRELARQLPCLWDAAEATRWPSCIQDALTEAGMQPVEPTAVAECESSFNLPADKAWAAGNWYLQPPGKPSAAHAASRTHAMRLVQLVAAEAETHELEEVFRHDATLSYQLLRLVNSAGMSTGRVVTSFAQAILILGRQQLRRWVNLLLFAARDDDPRSAMLMAHVTLRARGMELLAHEAGMDRSQQDQAFMAGMFSMLGVLFGQPLAQVIQPLNLTGELQQALVEQEGELGKLLSAWQAVEASDTTALAAALAPLGVQVSTCNDLLPQACAWMLSVAEGDEGHGGNR